MSYRPEKDRGSFEIWRERTMRIIKGAFILSLFAFFLFFVSNMDKSATNADAADCDCNLCHGDYHNNGWNGCNGCHDSPPRTGSHLAHYGNAAPQNLQYGDVTITSTADAYMFGCGNCHPLDPTKHRDGILQVELYNASAPAGSVKAKNPASAAYTPGTHWTSYTFDNPAFNIHIPYSYTDGTCNNVYCHSGYTVSSGSVGLPLCAEYDPAMPTRCLVYVLDEYGNLTYDPYTVTYSRAYKTTPAWGTNSDGAHSTFTTCTECHDFPHTTSYPSVQAGVGDSHQWVDEYGYGNLHGYNMGFDPPISCRTCHYGIVTQANTWTRDPMDIITYNPVPLASRVLHVNGSKDVVFDIANHIVYDTSSGPVTYDLQSATYDPATKTCSNAACHLAQTKVKWGSPYRWWNDAECDACHHFTR